MTLAPMIPRLLAAGAQAPARQAAATANTDSVDVGWPRQIASGGTTFTVYQPQLDRWEGDRGAGAGGRRRR